MCCKSCIAEVSSVFTQCGSSTWNGSVMSITSQSCRRQERLADSQHASKDLVEEEKVVNTPFTRNNIPVRKLQREREQHPPYHVIIVSQLNSIISHVITFI